MVYMVSSDVSLPEAETDEATALSDVWHVIVLNDPVNLMSYVVMVFKRVLGMSDADAEARMIEVHEDGRSVVWSGDREKAETYVFQLQEWHLTVMLERDESD